MKKEVIITIAAVAVVTLLPAILSAQPLPGGGPGGGGIAGAPIDPASWLIPAGVIAYHKYKHGKQAKPDANS